MLLLSLSHTLTRPPPTQLCVCNVRCSHSLFILTYTNIYRALILLALRGTDGWKCIIAASRLADAGD